MKIQRAQVVSSYRNVQMMGWISNKLWSEKQSLRNITQCIFPLHCLYSFLFIDTSISRKKNDHRSHGFTVIFPQLSFHPQPFCSPPVHHQKETVPVIKCTRTFTNINNWTMVRKDVTFLVGFSNYFKLSGFFLDLTKNPFGWQERMSHYRIQYISSISMTFAGSSESNHLWHLVNMAVFLYWPHH